jgi:hypothetical protein
MREPVPPFARMSDHRGRTLSRQGLMYVKSTDLHSFNMAAIIAFHLYRRLIVEAAERGVPIHTQGRYCDRRQNAGRAWRFAIIEVTRFTQLRT